VFRSSYVYWKKCFEDSQRLPSKGVVKLVLRAPLQLQKGITRDEKTSEHTIYQKDP